MLFRTLVIFFAGMFAMSLAQTCDAQQKPTHTVPGKVLEILPPGAKPKAEPSKVTFERINLGPNVNSPCSELFPVLSPDETVMYFTRQGDSQNVGFAKNPNDEDIWYSLKQPDGSWSQAQHLPGMLNNDFPNGVRAINSMGTHLYLQNIYQDDGTMLKGFSMSTKQDDGSWSFPKALEIEDYYNDTTISMMSVSTDEQHLILALKRKDGIGKHDLYLSNHLDGMKWSRPVLITELSSAGDDISPFITFDDHTLYFSTDGRGGLGGYDLFISRRLDSTWLHWTDPKNMGEPVNTPSFDAYLTIGARGDTAYFSSHHETSSRGFGRSDIWKLGMREEFRPGFALPKGNWWDPKLTAEDFKGQSLRLDNVLFDVGRATIKRESLPNLKRLAETLVRLPELGVEVQGHTDSDGKRENNMRLSQQRAQSVVDLLISYGAHADQLTAHGYGPDQPIAPNDTPQGKALNRRVMIEVTRTGSNVVVH
jgi:outer membrane protein OmpA-like peptidoglycan-associated protein